MGPGRRSAPPAALVAARLAGRGRHRGPVDDGLVDGQGPGGAGGLGFGSGSDRVVASERPRRRRFAQELAGSPFERLLRSSEIEIALTDAPEGTEVTMELSQQLRGASRLGGFMFRGAARRTLEEALESLERTVVG